MDDYTDNYMELEKTVIEQIKTDLENKDETSIYGLLNNVDRSVLSSYLPEEKWILFKKGILCQN